jgi:predicted SprT family Zn-dependent metalloprotease
MHDGSDMDRSPRRVRNNSDDATSTQGSSYDYNSVDDMEIDDANSLKRIHNDDAYSAGGQKRRAPSPAEDHMMQGMSAHTDFVRRRDISSRGSPVPRLTTKPQGSSLSSTSRSNSYMSTASITPSTATTTTTTSFGRRSPVTAFSPGGISPISCSSPYTTSLSLNPSPRTSISGRSTLHTRNVSGASPRKMNEMQKPGSKLQGFYMCECCPKKPKKFETAEELSAHEAEKQYECSFCGNRFKNKNEAERHQNSLHVRRHSWSCSALTHYDRAFHDSTNRPGEADTCGYCGDEFPRSGRGPGNGALNGGIVPRHATDEDWEERIRHLQEKHKFGECNSSKKFYRADHFRQHLKHSHAGTSGKWTNMLENACMLEEDPPVPR